MKKLTRLLAILVFAGWAGSANATLINVLLEVDITDLSAVTFSATGAAPSVDESFNTTFEGISLLAIFSSLEPFPGAISGNLMAHGTTESYNFALTLPSDFDLNLFCSGCSTEIQDFDTSFAAFTGVATVDLTGFSILGAGSYGDILGDDDLFSGSSIIGQWEIIDSSVPLPSTLALFGLGLLALWRRKA